MYIFRFRFHSVCFDPYTSKYESANILFLAGPKGPTTRVGMTRRELENKLVRGPPGYTGWTGYYGGTGATGFTGKVLEPIHTKPNIKEYATNIKENFRFLVHFRLVWTGL